MVIGKTHKYPSEQAMAVRTFLPDMTFFPIRPCPARVAAFRHQFQLRSDSPKQRYLANTTSANPDNPTGAPGGGSVSTPSPWPCVSDPTNSAPQPLNRCQHVLKTSTSAPVTALMDTLSSTSAKKNEAPRVQDGVPRGRPRRPTVKHRGRPRRVQHRRRKWMQGTSQSQWTESSRR